MPKNLKCRARETLNNLPQVEDISNPIAPDLREFHTYSLNQIKFLDEYQKDLDSDRAAKETGVSNTTKNKWLKEQKIQDVMNRIHDAYKEAIFMNSKYAAGRLPR